MKPNRGTDIIAEHLSLTFSLDNNKLPEPCKYRLEKDYVLVRRLHEPGKVEIVGPISFDLK